MGTPVSGACIAAAAVHYGIPSPITKLWWKSVIVRTLTVSNPKWDEMEHLKRYPGVGRDFFFS